MRRIIPGSEWGRVLRGTPPSPVDVAWLTVHYTGAPRVNTPKDQIDDRMRSSQAADLARPQYSAYKYNFAVDKWGRIWEGRGFEYRNAADGNQSINRDSMSVLVLVGVEDNEPTPDIVAGLQDLYRHATARFGRRLKVRCHKDVRATSCPGVLLEQLVRSGRIEAADPPPPAPDPVPVPVQPVDGDAMIAIYKPVFQGSGSQTPWVAVFGSGVVRRAVNADVRLAEQLGLPIVAQDSKEHHDYLMSLFP